MVFNVTGNPKKFVYPAIINVRMGYDHIIQMKTVPLYRDFAPRDTSAQSGIDLASDTMRRGLIENLIQGFMNKTKRSPNVPKESIPNGEKASDKPSDPQSDAKVTKKESQSDA